MKHDRERHSEERTKINEINPPRNVLIQNNVLEGDTNEEDKDLINDLAVETNDKSLAGITKEQPIKVCSDNKSNPLLDLDGNIWIFPAFEDTSNQEGKPFACNLCSSTFHNAEKLTKHKQNWHFNRGHPKIGAKMETLKEITEAELDLL